MDTLSRNMDFLVKHWAPFPRRFPTPFPVVTCDLVLQKEHWVRRAFNTCNFSLILRGQGEFRRDKKTWRVQAPCVITQWPGDDLEYGPADGETWTELYIIYHARILRRFKQSKLVNMQLPVWPIADLPTVNALAAELERLTKSATPELEADRVDRLCERLLMETRTEPHPAIGSDFAISQLLATLRRDFGKAVDFETLAEQNGMSASTFRRRWAEFSKTPPARYLQQLRMLEACRLLVETTRPVYEIAQAVGFEDELYFSRRFHKEMQLAPRDYRKAYRIMNNETRE